MTGQSTDGKRSIPEAEVATAFEQHLQEYRTLFDAVNILASRLYTGEYESPHTASVHTTNVGDVAQFLSKAEELKQYDAFRGCYTKDTHEARQRIEDMQADFTDVKIFDCVERFMGTDDDEEDVPAPRSKRQFIPASAPDLYFIGKQVRSLVRAARLFSANTSVDIAVNFHKFMEKKIESQLSLNTTVQYDDPRYDDPDDGRVYRAVIQHRAGTGILYNGLYDGEVREHLQTELEDVFADEIPECFLHRVFGTRDDPRTLVDTLRFLLPFEDVIIVTTQPYHLRNYSRPIPVHISPIQVSDDRRLIDIRLRADHFPSTAIRVDALKLDYYKHLRQQREWQETL
ncbi:hypothetical protein HYS47_05445 [Candidatus Woesearchaeota archaeon]|nr:hypothetical protein [Candidatus Woesearchaeota archaeon]